MNDTFSFSILGRIGGDATVADARVTIEGLDRLSVSSVGSEAMQPSSAWTNPRAICAFQYPRSDRRRCNQAQAQAQAPAAPAFSILGRIGGDATDPGVGPTRAVLDLSVSSVGSEAMQRGTAAGGERPPGHPFSILGRIGGDATAGTRRESGSRRPFSILGRIGGDATSLLTGVTRLHPPFSILGRIGGDATLRP